MTDAYSHDRFSACPIVGILRGFTLEQTLSLMELAVTTGLSTMEITMNTQGACDQIQKSIEQFGDKLNIGAGTVCDMDDLNQALAAGAQFIVTPVLDLDVIKYCSENNIPVFPGALTPTEIMMAWRAGATMIKLFPAEVMGPQYMKTLKGPLGQIPIMPTGGVTPESLHEWHAAGAKAYGVGGKLFNKDRVNAGEWNAIQDTAYAFIESHQHTQS